MILICIAVFFASMVGTVAGFGIATTLMPVVLYFFPIQTALLFTGIIHWCASLWMIFFYWRNVDMPILLWFGIPSIIATAVGALIAIYIRTPVFSLMMGIFLIFYAILKFCQSQLRFKKQMSTLAAGGGVSGLCAGLFGIRGAITSIFIAMFQLPKKTYLMTMASIAILVDTARVILYVWGFGSQQPTYVWGLIALGIPLSLLGAYVGQKIVHLIPQRIFYTLILGFLLITGIRLLIGY